MHDFEGSSDSSSHTDVCAKNTLLKEGKWQSIDGIQRESNTGNDGEQDQKHVQNEHHVSRLLPLVYCIHILQLY